MKSPFPGMDPYLEQHWLDVHSRLIIYSCDQLQDQLPRQLKARVEERVFVEPDFMEDPQTYYPDMRVIETPRSKKGNGRMAAAVGLAEPVYIPLIDVPPIRQGFLEIIDSSTGNRVVTVIEFLSPTNKMPGEGQDLYLKKQADVKKSDANYVEVDLTRRGKRRLLVSGNRLPPRCRTTFQACVRRAANPKRVEFYAMTLQSPLPTIAIPLRKSDADVTLNLQSLIELCYKNGRYDDLDYRVPPDPPLSPGDAKWAAAWLKKRQRRA